MKFSNIEHDKKSQRFILKIDGKNSAFLSYSEQNNVLYLNRSEVPNTLEEEGIGKDLVEQTFEYIESNNLTAVAICSYVQRVKNRNPKWRKVII